MLRLARKQRRIMVCHDQHKDKSTRRELFTEVYNNGGKVIRISGDSSQDSLLSLAKILMHRAEWRAFFAAEKDGMVTVRQGVKGINLQPPEELMRKVLALSTFDAERLKDVRPVRRTRTRREVAAQPRLMPR